MTQSESENPKLRLVDMQPIQYEGEAYLLLRDPLTLTETTLLVPQPFVPLLALCDGTRNISGIRGAMALRFGLFLPTQRIEEFVAALDNALLLDNERSRQARREASATFRQSAFRPPANAGLTYPEAAKELADYLQGYIQSLNGEIHPENGKIRGIVSPHIDYERGGPVYAKVWAQAEKSVQEAELVIIYGTDHFSEGYPFSLTRQNYATPFGILPTAQEIVDELAQVIGPETAFAGELHHRNEHSIELAAVWMHHMRRSKPVEMVPILCGALDGYLQDPASKLEPILDVLRRATQGRNTLVIAAGDLAHVGPAFGGEAVDSEKLTLLKIADDELIQKMCSGDAEGFYGAIQRVQDVNNVCGIAPIYLTLRLLAPVQGKSLCYAVCPADNQQTSVVTICGITLS